MQNTLLKTLLIGACLFQGLYTSAIAARGGEKIAYAAPRVATLGFGAGRTGEQIAQENQNEDS